MFNKDDSVDIDSHESFDIHDELNKRFEWCFRVAIIVFIFTFLITTSIVSRYNTKSIHDEAVEVGVGRYVADNKGNVDFQWITDNSD